MMNNSLYDSGECLLGQVSVIKKYIYENFKDYEDYEDLLKELNNYDEDSIVVIDYDHMGYLGYSIDEFTSSDIIYVESKERD
jgi:hypothetical protein|nr:MAG TPA_asm: hypothetical protein [Bacteriophage sp.]